VQTLSKLVVGIIGLNLVLVGALGATRALTRPRTGRRAVVVRRRGSGYVGLEPAETSPPLRARILGATLATALVVAGTFLIARDLHLIPQRVEARASEETALAQQPAVRHRPAGTRAPVVSSAPGIAHLHSGARPGGTGSGGASSSVGASQPASPSVVTAVPVSATVIRVTWANVGKTTRYRVQRSSGAPAGWRTIATTAPGVTTYRDAGLPPGTTYFYRVLATGADGQSQPSDVASSTTITLPSSPDTPIVMAATSTEIDLSWTDVTDESGFRIERSADGVTGWVAIATTGQGVTFYSDTQLAPDTTYYYRVFATNAGGDSVPSAVASATTMSESPSPAASI
jgi:Fibronectin type III domain